MTPTLLPPVDRRAVLTFLALVVLLLAPWPRWGRVFASAFSVYGNALIAVVGPTQSASRFDVPGLGAVSAADGGEWAVVLTARDQSVPLDTRIIAYTPLAIFLALALATPGPRRRRLVIVAGGGAVLLTRLAFAVIVPLYSASGSLAETAWTVFITPPAMCYAAPLAVWWGAVALTTPRARFATPQPRKARASARRA